jgi:acetoin utilization deacetylase AcuC-like enzyme
MRRSLSDCAPVHAFYADHFVLPLPSGHRFPMAKYARLRERLAREFPEVEMHEALPASDGELALVHTPAYIDAVASGTLSPALQREIGFPWSPAMAERARRSVGATLQAPRLRRQGQRLLRLQRLRRRGAADAGRARPPPRHAPAAARGHR